MYQSGYLEWFWIFFPPRNGLEKEIGKDQATLDNSIMFFFANAEQRRILPHQFHVIENKQSDVAHFVIIALLMS